MLTKNQLCGAEITGYSSEGLGICRVDGQVVFVHGGVRGDRCVIRILKANTRMAWAKLERIETPSPHRIQPDCKVYPACGGCHCRHMSYDEELYFKRFHVEQSLARIGGLSITAEEVLSAGSRNGCRNKAILPVTRVDGRIATGFYRARSHDVAAAELCLSAMPAINRCAAVTRGYLDKAAVTTYESATGKGLVRHLFVRATNNGTQAALVINGSRLPEQEYWIDALRQSCPDIQGILTIENRRTDNVVLGGGTVRTLWGQDILIETLGKLDFELHPLAFAQVHSAQAVRLYDRALEYALCGQTGTAVDLYCGAGTLTLWLAQRFRRVAGAESSSSAVECARRNAARNGFSNVEFIESDVGLLGGAMTGYDRPEVVTVDPPRSGLEPAALEAVTALSPERLVYVSCDPGTLARDVKRLMERGYQAERLTIADMFPGTRHVESVLALRKKH